MPRAQKRTWVKLFCYERLHGSVAYQLEPAERSVWDELLCLAGLCGLDGSIADRDQRPFPHSHIAHELHISEELLERTLTKCIEEGRITENEHGISITNWKVYQSEYDRQKPYRKLRKQGLPEGQFVPDMPPAEAVQPETDPTARIVAALTANYEKEIGIVSSHIATQLIDFAAAYHVRAAPLTWIAEAFAEAATHNKRSWAYVKAILTTWIDQGRPNHAGATDRTEEELEKEWGRQWEAKRKLRESSAD